LLRDRPPVSGGFVTILLTCVCVLLELSPVLDQRRIEARRGDRRHAVAVEARLGRKWSEWRRQERSEQTTGVAKCTNPHVSSKGDRQPVRWLMFVRTSRFVTSTSGSYRSLRGSRMTYSVLKYHPLLMGGCGTLKRLRSNDAFRRYCGV